MHKKKKEHKKRGIGWTILRIFLGAAGILVLVLVVYIGYLFASYHRIEDNLELEVEKPAEGNVDETLKTGTEYSALTYNIGFGAYTPDFSFFMDGGKSSWVWHCFPDIRSLPPCGEASRSPLLLPNFSTWTAATASPGSRWKTAKNW